MTCVTLTGCPVCISILPTISVERRVMGAIINSIRKIIIRERPTNETRLLKLCYRVDSQERIPEEINAFVPKT